MEQYEHDPYFLSLSSDQQDVLLSIVSLQEPKEREKVLQLALETGVFDDLDGLQTFLTKN